MKRLFAVICVFFLGFSAPAWSEVAIGITANFSELDTDGSETELSGDLEKTNASASEDVTVPEVFAEVIADNGLVIGVSYIPARELGAKSRTDTTPTADDETADAGVYSAKAEVENVVLLYTNIPVGPVYAILGYTRASMKTLESNPTGTTYGDKDVNGYTYGIGYRGQGLPFVSNGFYKAEVAFTDFDEFSATDSNGDHKVTASTDVTSVKISVGLQF